MVLVAKDESAFVRNSGDVLTLDFSDHAGPEGVVGAVSLIESDLEVWRSDGGHLYPSVHQRGDLQLR